jgi:hypothetical protein
MAWQIESFFRRRRTPKWQDHFVATVWRRARETTIFAHNCSTSVQRWAIFRSGAHLPCQRCGSSGDLRRQIYCCDIARCKAVRAGPVAFSDTVLIEHGLTIISPVLNEPLDLTSRGDAQTERLDDVAIGFVLLREIGRRLIALHKDDRGAGILHPLLQFGILHGGLDGFG